MWRRYFAKENQRQIIIAIFKQQIEADIVGQTHESDTFVKSNFNLKIELCFQLQSFLKQCYSLNFDMEPLKDPFNFTW